MAAGSPFLGAARSRGPLPGVWPELEPRRGLRPHGALLLQVVEVGHFWGYRIDEKNAATLKKLMAEIKRLKLAPLAVHPHPDLVCLAPFADAEERSYFRAQILYVSGNSAEVRQLPLTRGVPRQFRQSPHRSGNAIGSHKRQTRGPAGESSPPGTCAAEGRLHGPGPQWTREGRRAGLALTAPFTRQVFFVDYGNKCHVDLDLLMEIPSQLLELPFQVGGLRAVGPGGGRAGAGGACSVTPAGSGLCFFLQVDRCGHFCQCCLGVS